MDTTMTFTLSDWNWLYAAYYTVLGYVLYHLIRKDLIEDAFTRRPIRSRIFEISAFNALLVLIAIALFNQHPDVHKGWIIVSVAEIAVGVALAYFMDRLRDA